MINNIIARDELQYLYRRKSKRFIARTVPIGKLQTEIDDGWTVERKSKTSARLTKQKSHDVILEDRVWCLLYRMGFTQLSADRGAILDITDNTSGPTSRVDAVAIDDEVAVAIECISAESTRKRPMFAEELGKHNLIRSRFSQAVNTQFPSSTKRVSVLAMFTSNIILVENDRQRAEEAKVVLFDEIDLQYYENLVNHLGYAARYQFLSDLLANRTIEGLHIRVPAVKTKMAGVNCYTFAISPDYLLKIAFVSHRAKGHASDVHTYQRMIAKGRLRKIRDYISEGGIFPTNIVVNLDKNSHIVFERTKQETDQESSVLGWLDFKPAYKSAWVIDGQHRLFAYAGHPMAGKSLVSVVAFEGLLPSKQAQLFIDINAEQKRVKQSLLQELFAELHWDSENPRTRVQAIISKAIAELGVLNDSPFCDRIQRSDDGKSAIRCISLTSIFSALEKGCFFIAKEKHGHIVEYGPMWAGDNRLTLARAVRILKAWFDAISTRSNGWWDLGASDGGGLAMNDSVIACINVLRSVFEHIEMAGQKLVREDDTDVIKSLIPYAEIVGDYLGSLSSERRKEFRNYRGVQGQNTRTRLIQLSIKEMIHDFSPDGLEKWLVERTVETNKNAREIIDRVEQRLQSVVIDELKANLGENESEWWMEGVPEKIRLDARVRWEQDKGKRGGTERYLNLIDYRTIIVRNWAIFQGLLAYGKGSKDARTEWIARLNEVRKIVMHSSSGQHVSVDKLEELRTYDDWLENQLKDPVGEGIE